jgi:cellulose biosynthesis protein BcsQ
MILSAGPIRPNRSVLPRGHPDRKLSRGLRAWRVLARATRSNARSWSLVCLDFSPLPCNVVLSEQRTGRDWWATPSRSLQANAVNTLANNQIPGTNPWIAVVDWLNDFLDQLKDEYDIVFMDCNPSFSLYTQIALAASSRIVLPDMADDSSRRAIQNAFSLIYGLKLPSEIYAAYAFATKLRDAGRKLPKVHLIAKNRLTQYMGAASAYAAVLAAVERDVEQLMKSNPSLFTFTNLGQGFVEVRDFQTTGVVAFAKGLPFSKLQVGKQTINGHRGQVKEEYLENAKHAIQELVSRL